ncbi:MAG TPA: phage baseplate assembly protein V [Pyrinomonadaceae bacterium]|nr:phage baseplate assembly protein V [Pyrinomonadaceae bacterium]
MGADRVNGIIIGIVTDLEDPEAIGRIKVMFPTLGDQASDWARLVTPMAGKDRGLFLRPEVGDEVLVAFELGDPTRPYILGSLWNKVDTPPPDDGQAGQNNWRFIKSRSGHIVKLDDTQGAEKIEIIGSDGQRQIVFDIAGKKIQVVCDTGDVEVSATGGTVKVEALTVEVKASGNMTLEATGTMTIKGATVNIN